MIFFYIKLKRQPYYHLTAIAHPINNHKECSLLRIFTVLSKLATRFDQLCFYCTRKYEYSIGGFNANQREELSISSTLVSIVLLNVLKILPIRNQFYSRSRWCDRKCVIEEELINISIIA